MQELNTSSTSTGLSLAKNVEEGDVTVAEAITTGELRIGNRTMAGDMYIKGQLYPPPLVVHTTARLTNTLGQAIVNQRVELTYVRSAFSANFTLRIEYDDLNEWLGNGAGVYAIIDKLPLVFSHLSAMPMFWAGPNPFPNANRNDTFAASARIGLSDMWLHNYSAAFENRLETRLFLNQAGSLLLNGVVFITA